MNPSILHILLKKLMRNFSVNYIRFQEHFIIPSVTLGVRVSVKMIEITMIFKSFILLFSKHDSDNKIFKSNNKIDDSNLLRC